MRLCSYFLLYPLCFCLYCSLSLGLSKPAFSQIQQQQKPQHIVSLSLCSDLLLLQLADKENIASLSYLAAEPEYSYLSQQVADIPLNRGQAEEVLQFKPDLIIGSQFSATMAINLLKQLDHSVTMLSFPANLDEIYQQIRQVASLLLEPERGEKLIADMQSRITQTLTNIPSAQRNKLAVFYSNNGYTYGNNTLRNSFLSTLGLRNLAAEVGISGSGQLNLETLLSAEPDFLLMDSPHQYTNQLAQAILKHPALQQSFTTKNMITIPDQLFQCAGPSLVDAFEIMLTQLESAS